MSGDALIALVRFLWSGRACFVCGGRGECAHREMAVDVACYEADLRRLARTAAEPSEPQPWLPGFAPEEVHRVQ